MTIPTITALPPPPSRTTQSAAAFNAATDAWLGAQADMVTELNTFGDAVDAAGTAIDADVATVAADKGTVAADKGIVAADKATVAADKATVAADKATVNADKIAAAASAAAAAVSAATAASVIGSSTTSLGIAVASKTFTTQAGKNWQVGSYVIAASAADPANFMFGQVTSYSGTSLIVDVQAVGGSGTLADWNISLAGARGATGATGAASTWVTIASSTTTGGSTIDFTSIPTTYQDLMLVFGGVSDNTGGAEFGVKVSANNGGAWSATGMVLKNSTSSGAEYSGDLLIPKYRGDFGGGHAAVASLSASPDAGPSTYSNAGGAWLATGGINALRLYLTAGTFDAMNVTLYGK